MNGGANDKLLEQLSAYLDGELSPAQRAEVETMLAGNAELRALLDELRGLSNSFKSLPRAKAGDELVDNLRTRMERRALLDEDTSIRKTVVATGGRRRNWLAVAALIALSLTAGIAMWAFSEYPEEASPPPSQYALADKGEFARSAPPVKTEYADADAAVPSAGGGQVSPERSREDIRMFKLAEPKASVPTSDHAAGDERRENLYANRSIERVPAAAAPPEPPAAPPATAYYGGSRAASIQAEPAQENALAARVAKPTASDELTETEVADASGMDELPLGNPANEPRPMSSASLADTEGDLLFSVDKYLGLSESTSLDMGISTLSYAVGGADQAAQADSMYVSEPSDVRLVAFDDPQQMDQAVVELQSRHRYANAVRNEFAVSSESFNWQASPVANAAITTQPQASPDEPLADWTIDVPDQRSQLAVVADLERYATASAQSIQADAASQPASAWTEPIADTVFSLSSPIATAVPPSTMPAPVANQAVDTATSFNASAVLVPQQDEYQSNAMRSAFQNRRVQNYSVQNALRRRLLVEVRVAPSATQPAPADEEMDLVEPDSSHGRG